MSPRADSSIEIGVPIERVWAVLVDVSAYPAWNPFVVEVAGVSSPVRVGDRMRFRVRWGDGGGASSIEEIDEMDPPRAGEGEASKRARWVYTYRGALDSLNLVRGRRVQELEALEGGRTKYRSHEDFRGLFARFVPIGKVQDGFDRQAAALKRRAETLSARA